MSEEQTRIKIQRFIDRLLFRVFPYDHSSEFISYIRGEIVGLRRITNSAYTILYVLVRHADF